MSSESDWIREFWFDEDQLAVGIHSCRSETQSHGPAHSEQDPTVADEGSRAGESGDRSSSDSGAGHSGGGGGRGDWGRGGNNSGAGGRGRRRHRERDTGRRAIFQTPLGGRCNGRSVWAWDHTSLGGKRLTLGVCGIAGFGNAGIEARDIRRRLAQTGGIGGGAAAAADSVESAVGLPSNPLAFTHLGVSEARSEIHSPRRMEARPVERPSGR